MIHSQFSKSVISIKVSLHRHSILISGKSISKIWVNRPFHDGPYSGLTSYFPHILFIHSANIHEVPNIFQALCIRLGAQDKWNKQNSWSSESLKFSRETDNNQSQSNVFKQEAFKEWFMQQTFQTLYKVGNRIDNNNNNKKDTNFVPVNFSHGDRPESDVIQVKYYII